jgi:phage terminase large subunit-like protein
LNHYAPYEKQLAFHAAGATHRERLLIAANQSGKSYSGAMEAAAHATGRYPSWWTGKRFDKPTVGWVCGETSEVVRDTVQRLLVGRPGSIGTGAIPKDAIADTVTARGVADLLDTIKVHHVSGGISIIGLKSYISGRERFQGETLDWVHCDEEPDISIYTEILTRTNISQGPVWTTFTPLRGASDVVRRFLHEKSPGRHVTSMTIEDVDHYTTEEKQAIILSYPEHERDARTKGIPILGSGRVFPLSEERITVEHRDIPAHWPRIIGVDFGFTHPFAAVEVCWDRDTDTVYVTKCHCVSEQSPVYHASVLRAWGAGKIPVAWPRDGRRQTLEGAGIPLMRQYQDEGCNMLFEHSQFEDGSVSVEAGLMLLLDRMKTGRFKVFKELNDWFDEFRLYHRRDGKVFAEREDLMSATRYACMSLRHAQTGKAYDNFRREIIYPEKRVI